LRQKSYKPRRAEDRGLPISGWDNFFVAQLGASAALAGLVFVGVSINLSRILSIETLPERAIQALVMLMAILVVSSLLLVPGQSMFAVGIEVLVVGVPVWFMNLRFDIRNLKKIDEQFRRSYKWTMVLSQAALLPYAIAGIVTIWLGGVGIYWLVPAVVISFIKAIMDAWVLLVEINR
jgi:hypothetical protein